MNICRVIGMNVLQKIREKNLEVEAFATQLGYTLQEAWWVIEGRTFVPPVELERIANVLDTTKKYLICEHEKMPREFYFVKEFDNDNKLDEVLDLIDEYVEFLEVTE